MEQNGTPIDVTLAGSETFRVPAPNCVSIPGCDPNFTTNAIGTPVDEFLVNILESAGGPYPTKSTFTAFPAVQAARLSIFISDPATFDTPGPGAIVTTLVETGSLQPALTYTRNEGNLVDISFTSAVDVAPEIGTLSLLGLGLGVLVFFAGANRAELISKNQPPQVFSVQKPLLN